MSGTDEGTTDHGPVVARFLAQFASTSRAEAVHFALKALRARVEPDRALACELAWEVHARGYWSQLRSDQGKPYESEETYFRDVLGLSSWRTAYKRLAIGRMLSVFPEPERTAVRASVAQVGVAKASVVVPAIEHTADWATWLECARQLSYPLLQVRVSEVLQASPRGRAPNPPGERFRRAVLSAMPDIEAMELVERFFAIGAKVVGTPHPVGIFLAGCRESLAEWEIQAAQRRPRPASVSSSGSQVEPSGEPADKKVPEAGAIDLARPSCPRGQNGVAQSRLRS